MTPTANKPEGLDLASELAIPDIDVAKLVSFSPNPQLSEWLVSGGSARWRGRVGRYIGVLSIKNARADAVVLLFNDNSIGCFNGIDLFPAAGG